MAKPVSKRTITRCTIARQTVVIPSEAAHLKAAYLQGLHLLAELATEPAQKDHQTLKHETSVALQEAA